MKNLITLVFTALTVNAFAQIQSDCSERYNPSYENSNDEKCIIYRDPPAVTVLISHTFTINITEYSFDGSKDYDYISKPRLAYDLMLHYIDS